MPTLAGWLTGEQVAPEIIEETLAAMGAVLGQHGGTPAHSILPGAGLIAFSDTAYAMRQNDEPPVLDWVPDRRTLVYRRPLSGLHALYFIENWPAQGNLLFASEIKALFAVGVPRRLHLPALDALLRYGFIPAPWTAFRDIQVVPAGSILRWQRAKTVLNQATDYHFEEESEPGGGLLEQCYSQLEEASASLLPPHEQLVALSGGSPISALAVLLARRHTTAPFTVAALAHARSLTAKAWEAAESIAEACQSPFLAITSVDEPSFWAATLAGTEAPSLDSRSLALHQLLHTAVTQTKARVALSGLGGGMLLGKDLQKRRTAEGAPAILDRYSQLLTGSAMETTSRLWSPEVREQLGEERWEETLHARKLARKAEKFADRGQAYYYLDLHLRLPDYAVNPAQQLAVQEGIALRSPYLHGRVMDILSHLPAQLTAEMLHYAASLTYEMSYTPQLARTRSLALTIPTNSLLRTPGVEIVQQTLSGEALRASGIFDVEAVEKLLKRGKKASEKEVIFVFTTQLLAQLFEATI